MINTETFFKSLKSLDYSFYCGVPDSLLKDLCAYITDHCSAENHVITANEGSAVALASGYHLATNKVPVVYLQNSGTGNIINPLLSLVDPDVYNIPVLFIIGWRGEPNESDEPQHIKQGRIMEKLLTSLEFDHTVLSKETDDFHEKLVKITENIKESKKSHFLLIKKGTFTSYKLKSNIELPSISLTRENAIAWVLDRLTTNDRVVSTTGMISREVYDLRVKSGADQSLDFLTVGSMGHASQIALGIALNTTKRVICLDGDGALIMHMGGLSTIGSLAPKNYIHVVLNNGAHDSVGGQPTTSFSMDLPSIATACGYKKTFKVSSLDELEQKWIYTEKNPGPIFIEVIVKKGNRPDLGRPKTKPIENKIAFQKKL